MALTAAAIMSALKSGAKSFTKAAQNNANMGHGGTAGNSNDEEDDDSLLGQVRSKAGDAITTALDGADAATAAEGAEAAAVASDERLKKAQDLATKTRKNWSKRK